MTIKIINFSQQEFNTYLKNQLSSTLYYSTPAGVLKTLSTRDGVYNASFIPETTKQAVPLAKEYPTTFILVGTVFEQAVWQEALTIQPGTTISYQELATKIGRISAHRAVANALGRNRLAYFVPCHRILRKNGQLGGYRWGIEKKEALLQSEKI